MCESRNRKVLWCGAPAVPAGDQRRRLGPAAPVRSTAWAATAAPFCRSATPDRTHEGSRRVRTCDSRPTRRDRAGLDRAVSPRNRGVGNGTSSRRTRDSPRPGRESGGRTQSHGLSAATAARSAAGATAAPSPPTGGGPGRRRDDAPPARRFHRITDGRDGAMARGCGFLDPSCQPPAGASVISCRYDEHGYFDRRTKWVA
jgi:hypothetical protein